MKFTDLEIQNFLAITSAKINLADRGLVVIQGVNEDDTSAISNGAGKSTIADALCWCWYGTTAREVSGDDVVNDDAGKDCQVRSTVIDGAYTYTAVRHRKHKTGKNTFTLEVNDGFTTTNLTKGTDKLTQEVAERILGSSHEVFVGSVYAGQEKMPNLPALTDKNLKLIVEEASGVTVLEDAYREARGRLALSTASASMEEQTLANIHRQLAMQNEQKANMLTLANDWNVARDQRVEKLELSLKSSNGELSSLQTLFAAYDTAAIINGIAECDLKLSSHSAKTAKLNLLTSAVLTSEASLKALAQTAKQKSAEYKERVNLLANIEHQVGCPCSSCGREITVAEIGAASLAAQTRIDESSAEIDLLKKQNAEQKVQLAAAIVERDTFASTVENLDDVIASKRDFEKSQSAYTAHNHAIANLQLVIDNERNNLAALKIEENPHIAAIAPIDLAIDNLENSIKSQELRLEAHQRSVEVDTQVMSVYSPSGVRAHVMDEITPYLNTQTSKYLSVLSDSNIMATWTTLTKDSRGEMKEKFTIDVTNATGAKIYKGLSGGEKRKVRLATVLALQDLVSTRATKPIELFIGDEIDDALDAAGIERLMIILEEKATERGSVFVISHNELRDHIKQAVIITKKDKKTEISEVIG